MVRSAFLAVVLLCLASVAEAQLAATVPAEDPVYGLLTEVYDELGLPGFVAGQGPLSRREIRRLARAADADLARRAAEPGRSSPPRRIRDAVQAMLDVYAPELREGPDSARRALRAGAPIEALRIEVLGTSSSARRVLDNGLGKIDAYTNPLTDARWGRPVPNDGGVLDVETSHRVGIGDHLAFGAQTRFAWLGDTSGSRWNAGFQRLYARAAWHNAALEVGPDEYLWGLGGSRGMLLSAQPEPLHAISLSTDTTIVLPWILHVVGPSRFAALVSDLGQDRNFPGSRLYGYRVDATPTPRLELGGGMLVQMGGRGSPSASSLSRIATAFPYVFWIIAPGRDTVRAAHLAEAEIRYRVWESRGLAAYYELDLTDFDPRRLGSVISQNGTHLFGLTIQRLAEDGRLAADVQFKQTSLYQAEHYEYTSGMTYHQAILGEPLGPNAKAGYGTISWRPQLLETLSLTGAIESRDPSLFVVESPDVLHKVVKTVQGTREVRQRLLLSYVHARLATGLTMRASVGVEHADGYAFTSGLHHTSALGDIVFRLAF